MRPETDDRELIAASAKSRDSVGTSRVRAEPPSWDVARRTFWYVVWLVGPLVVVAVIWQLVYMLGNFASYVLPAPATVAATFWEYMSDGALLEHLGASFVRLLLGFFVGAGLAIPLGIAMGTRPRVGKFFDPLVNLGQAIPGLAWIPLAILWFGLGYTAVTFIIFTSVFFPVLFSTLSGVRAVPQVLLNAVATMGATRRQATVSVIVMGSLPSLTTGLRIGMGYAWRALVGAEMIAATSGLGWMIFDARNYLRSDVVIMGMLTMGIAWIIMDRLLLKPFERRTIERWGLSR